MNTCPGKHLAACQWGVATPGLLGRQRKTWQLPGKTTARGNPPQPEPEF